ncbi:MAG: amidophosphoribosyltransferase, partial [Sedimenticolaceae bacterium]
LVAHGRTEQEVCEWIGADGLVFQDLDDLIDAVGKKVKTAVQRFDTSVFNGEYVTGDITPEYLSRLEADRNDDAKASRDDMRAANVIGLHNDR